MLTFNKEGDFNQMNRIPGFSGVDFISIDESSGGHCIFLERRLYWIYELIL